MEFRVTTRKIHINYKDIVNRLYSLDFKELKGLRRDTNKKHEVKRKDISSNLVTYVNFVTLVMYRIFLSCILYFRRFIKK